MHKQLSNFKVLNGLTLLLSRRGKLIKNMGNLGYSFNGML
jgi:hypothetical protein